MNKYNLEASVLASMIKLNTDKSQFLSLAHWGNAQTLRMLSMHPYIFSMLCVQFQLGI